MRNCPAGFKIAIQIAYLDDFGSEEPNEGPCTEKALCNKLHTQPHPTPRVNQLRLLSATKLLEPIELLGKWSNSKIWKTEEGSSA